MITTSVKRGKKTRREKTESASPIIERGRMSRRKLPEGRNHTKKAPHGAQMEKKGKKNQPRKSEHAKKKRKAPTQDPYSERKLATNDARVEGSNTYFHSGAALQQNAVSHRGEPSIGGWQGTALPYQPSGENRETSHRTCAGRRKIKRGGGKGRFAYRKGKGVGAAAGISREKKTCYCPISVREKKGR